MDKHQLCSEIVNLIREQRHDFTNHFQVILGYLQLNKTDLATLYIKQKNAEMQELSILNKLENPYLAVALYLAFQKSQSMGIELSFHFGENVSFEHDYGELLVDELFYTINMVIEQLGEIEDEEQWLEVTLDESNQSINWILSCSSSFSFENLMGKLKDKFAQDDKLEERIKAEKLAHQVMINFQIVKNK